jgi:hypothetical protein
MESGRRELTHSSIKLGLDQIGRAQHWARRETEGNVSQMVRKLLDEAIAARDASESPGVGETL